MFLKKENTPKITFRCREDLVDALPKPQRASKFMPEWLKKLPRVQEGRSLIEPGTVKRCVPVADAISQGYIIPAWCDYLVRVYEDEIEDDEGNKAKGAFIKVEYPTDLNMGYKGITTHAWDQVGNDCPLKAYPVGKVLLKFSNPWIIETAPGWSCSFKSPANHYNNVRIMDGVVDTDNYYTPINFPWFWDGCQQGEFWIKKGDPLIHVVPFKRETTELAHGTWDMKKWDRHERAHFTHFFDKYRKLWWHKRK